MPPRPKPPGQVLADGVASVASDSPVEGHELQGRSIVLAVAAACEDADLLVCGSRGYGLSSRVMIGSVSTALMESAPCPVMIVPRPTDGGQRRPQRQG